MSTVSVAQNLVLELRQELRVKDEQLEFLKLHVQNSSKSNNTAQPSAPAPAPQTGLRYPNGCNDLVNSLRNSQSLFSSTPQQASPVTMAADAARQDSSSYWGLGASSPQQPAAPAPIPEVAEFRGGNVATGAAGWDVGAGGGLGAEPSLSYPRPATAAAMSETSSFWSHGEDALAATLAFLRPSTADPSVSRQAGSVSFGGLGTASAAQLPSKTSQGPDIFTLHTTTTVDATPASAAAPTPGQAPRSATHHTIPTSVGAAAHNIAGSSGSSALHSLLAKQAGQDVRGSVGDGSAGARATMASAAMLARASEAKASSSALGTIRRDLNRMLANVADQEDGSYPISSFMAATIKSMSAGQR